MADREVLALNESTPQIEAAQSGDRYSFVREIVIADGITVSSAVADGATAVAFDLDSDNTLSTAGANLLRLSNNATPVFDFSYQGGIDHVNSGASTAAHSQSLNLNWTASGTETSSGQYSAVIGVNNRSTGTHSLVAGASNSNTSNYAYLFGSSNTGGGAYSIAVGDSNTSPGWGACFGRKASSNLVASLWVGGVPGSFSVGERQTGFLTATLNTTDATQTTLKVIGNDLVIPPDTTWAFSALLVARSDETDGNLSAAWRLEGCLTRDESGNTALVGSVTKTVIADGAAGAWDVTAEADDTNNALAIKVTGEAATNIRWVAKVDISQVTYA